MLYRFCFKLLAEKDKRTLFVRNLPWGTDEDALAEHFSGCEQVRLPRNDDGKIRGLAKFRNVILKCCKKLIKEKLYFTINKIVFLIHSATAVDFTF